MTSFDRFSIVRKFSNCWECIDHKTLAVCCAGTLYEIGEWIELQELKHGMGGETGQAGSRGQQGSVPERDATTRE